MATVVSTHQRHVLTPLSPKRRTVLGNVTNIVRGLQDVAATAASNGKLNGKGLSFSKPSHALKPLGLTLSTTPKRPFSSVAIYDENATLAAPIPAGQSKRMKSQQPSCEESSTIPRYALVTKPQVSAVPTGIVVSKKKVSGSGAPTSSSSGLKRRTNSSVGSATSSVATTTAQSRKDTLATLSSPSKTLKRKIQKSIRRVDPPSSSKPTVDVSSPESIDGRLIATPVSKTGQSTTASSWRPGQPFPKSWMFDIHEDTLEETLTNLMYHGAGVLDISDEEDRVKKGISEVDRVGKENIPPPPSEDSLAMPPPPSRRVETVEEEEAGMDAERSRSPLGDVDVEVFYPNLKKEREEAERLKAQKAADKKKAAGLLTSKFAVIDEIVKDYMAQQKEEKEESVDAENIPLPEEEDDLEEQVEEEEEVSPVVSSASLKVEVPTISVENCDYDAIIASQSRSMAEDELFDDDL